MSKPLPHGAEPASDWVKRWTHLVAPKGRVLDVACGQGRHARWFHEHGYSVVAVDISQPAIAALSRDLPDCQALLADIENQAWPLADEKFDAVIVTNYLWRALMPTLLASLAPGGVLIYETFTDGNATVGKPSRADFLLQTGELLAVCQGLRVVAFEDGFEDAVQAQSPANIASHGQRFVQRIAAVREALPADPIRLPARYKLG